MSENQTKKISLLDLKYTKLRKKIGEVEIYNPNKELKLELDKEFTKRITEAFQSDNLNINTTIGMGEMLTMYIPLLTNIDCPEDVLLSTNICSCLFIVSTFFIWNTPYILIFHYTHIENTWFQIY